VYPSFAAMAEYILNVSLKANPIPYGLIAQAIFANVEASFLHTAEHDITLSHHSELVVDQGQIATLLAGKAAISEGSSKASVLDCRSMCSRTHIHPGSRLFEYCHSTTGNVGLSGSSGQFGSIGRSSCVSNVLSWS